jgi:hypothetical protein
VVVDTNVPGGVLANVPIGVEIDGLWVAMFIGGLGNVFAKFIAILLEGNDCGIALDEGGKPSRAAII